MMYNVLHPWMRYTYSVLIYTNYFVSKLSLSPDLQADYHYSVLRTFHYFPTTSVTVKQVVALSQIPTINSNLLGTINLVTGD